MRSESEFTEERGNDLIRAYKAIMIYKLPENIHTHRQIIELALNSQSSRYWVTAESLYKAILRMRKGDALEEMKPIRREMFFKLYSMYKEYLKDNPIETSLFYICCELVGRKADKFYASPESGIKWYRKQVNINRLKRMRYI